MSTFGLYTFDDYFLKTGDKPDEKREKTVGSVPSKGRLRTTYLKTDCGLRTTDSRYINIK